jgi:hypothetical protein
VGKGKTFEILQPAAYLIHAEASRKLALSKRDMLRAGA